MPPKNAVGAVAPRNVRIHPELVDAVRDRLGMDDASDAEVIRTGLAVVAGIDPAQFRLHPGPKGPRRKRAAA